MVCAALRFEMSKLMAPISINLNIVERFNLNSIFASQQYLQRKICISKGISSKCTGNNYDLIRTRITFFSSTNCYLQVAQFKDFNVWSEMKQEKNAPAKLPISIYSHISAVAHMCFGCCVISSYMCELWQRLSLVSPLSSIGNKKKCELNTYWIWPLPGGALIRHLMCW